MRYAILIKLSILLIAGISASIEYAVGDIWQWVAALRNQLFDYQIAIQSQRVG